MLNNAMVYNLELNGSTKINGDIRFSGDLYKSNVVFTGGPTNIYQSGAKTGIHVVTPQYGFRFRHIVNTGVFEDTAMVVRSTSGPAVFMLIADQLNSTSSINYQINHANFNTTTFNGGFGFQDGFLKDPN